MKVGDTVVFTAQLCEVKEFNDAGVVVTVGKGTRSEQDIGGCNIKTLVVVKRKQRDVRDIRLDIDAAQIAFANHYERRPEEGAQL